MNCDWPIVYMQDMKRPYCVLQGPPIQGTRHYVPKPISQPMRRAIERIRARVLRRHTVDAVRA